MHVMHFIHTKGLHLKIIARTITLIILNYTGKTKKSLILYCIIIMRILL